MSLFLLLKTFSFQYHPSSNDLQTLNDLIICLIPFTATFGCRLFCWEMAEDDCGVLRSNLKVWGIVTEEYIKQNKNKEIVTDSNNLLVNVRAMSLGMLFKREKKTWLAKCTFFKVKEMCLLRQLSLSMRLRCPLSYVHSGLRLIQLAVRHLCVVSQWVCPAQVLNYPIPMWSWLRKCTHKHVHVYSNVY
jgi:hypothetical protein